MFSDRTLEEIRARLNIVDVVAEYLPLKKAGASLTALCPFHKEKSPSFHVHPVKQVFHCFGCHKGGNVFTFVSAIEGLSFPETVRKLAERTGVEIQEERKRRPERSEPPPDAKEARTLQALEWAAKYFHYLLTDSRDGRHALDYLTQRGISKKTIDRFRLGVAPKGWNTLRDLMLKRGFTTPELVVAGLLAQKEPGEKGGYDRFRNRLMFPIRNAKGKVIGFGARVLPGEDPKPKYLNSPESPLFSKRAELYGIFENQRDIRLKGEAIVVEGYMDVVGLADKGVTNAVATMGTALTAEHCEPLRRLAPRVVTVFDPDPAGQEAWHRSVDLFLAHRIFAKDLELPDGMDPDEFVLAHGADKFYELCQKAPRQITKLLKEIAAAGMLSEEQTAEWLKKLTPILVATRNTADRALLWDSVSLVLGVSIEALKELTSAQRPARAAPAVPGKVSPPAPRRPMGAAGENEGSASRMDPLDRQFLEAALANVPAFQALPKERWSAGLKDPKVRGWLDSLHAATTPQKLGEALAAMAGAGAPALVQAAASRALLAEAGSEPGNRELFEALAERLALRQKELEIEALARQVKLLARMGDEKAQLELLGKLKELRGDT